MLHDCEVCPIPLRDAAWGFYDRYCSRWERGTLSGHTTSVNSLAFSPDGLTLASASEKSVRLWDVKTQKTKAILQGGASCVAFSPDGLTLATTSEKKVLLWDVKTGQIKTTLQGHKWPVSSVAFSPDGLTLGEGFASFRV